jgi:hypothetical protein
MHVLLVGLTGTATGIDQIRAGVNTTFVVLVLAGTGRRREEAVRSLVRSGVRRQQLCDGRRDENARCRSCERDTRRRQLLVLLMLLLLLCSGGR